MPDALAKTVPIWCTVINRMLWPEAKDFHGLYLPEVSMPSEKGQIEARLQGFVQAMKVSGIGEASRVCLLLTEDRSWTLILLT